MNNPGLSAIIIAKNETEKIKECIESIAWVSEIIVINNDSIDKTGQIAKSLGAKVFNYKGGNYSDLRNFGARKAQEKWVLYVDSDERVTPLLRKEIESVLINPEYQAFAIPRRNILLGHEMKYGGWWPDYVLRLIKKDSLVEWKGKLHEQPKIKGEISKLKEPLVHITHDSLTEMVNKTNEWSEIEAMLLFESKHPKMNLIRFFSAAFREFWYRGVKKMGFLDGPVGIIEVIYQTFSRTITYAKLWEMQITNK